MRYVSLLRNFLSVRLVLRIQCVVVRLRKGFHLCDVVLRQQTAVQMGVRFIQPVCHVASCRNLPFDGAQGQVVAGFLSANAFFIMLTAFSITLSSTSSVMKGFSQSGRAPRSAAKTCAFFFAP